MEELPRNSTFTPDKKVAEPEVKKIEKITSGKVTVRKTPIGKKIKELFIGGDPKEVRNRVFFDLLVPSAKDTILDASRTYLEGILFPGTPRSSRGRSGFGAAFGGGRTDYNGLSRTTYGRPAHSAGPQMSPAGRSRHDFGEIILDSRQEAEAVLTQLFELLSKFEQVTVADLYSMVGIATNFPDNSWGWTDLRGSLVSRAPRGGYVLELPRPEPLER